MRARVTQVTRRRLGDAADAGLSGPSTAEERLALVETLTREAWALAGRPLPSYARGDAPVRVVALDPRSARDDVGP